MKRPPKKTMKQPRRRLECEHCHSNDVVQDALVVWDEGTQRWAIDHLFNESARCNNCDARDESDDYDGDDDDPGREEQIVWVEIE